MTDEDYYNRMAADAIYPPGPPTFAEYWAECNCCDDTRCHTGTSPNLHTPNTYRRPQDFLWLCWEWMWMFLGVLWFLLLMGYVPPPWKWFK